MKRLPPIPMKAFLVEDEIANLEHLKETLTTHFPDIEIVGEGGSIDESYKKIVHTSPNLLFLDIRLPDGLSFQLVKKLMEHNNFNAALIFMTGWDDYSYPAEAANHQSIAFIKKQVVIDIEELRAALTKAQTAINDKNLKKIAEDAFNFILNSEPQKAIIIDSTPISIDDILYLESVGPKTVFHQANNSSIIGNRNLGYYNDFFLNNGYAFYKTHRSYSINMDFFKNYNTSKQIAFLKNGRWIPVSRENAKQFKEYVERRPKKEDTFYKRFINFFRGFPGQ